MIFGLAAPAIDVLIKGASVASGEIGDDEAGIGAFLARLDASDDPLDAAPARRAVEELLEAADLAVSRGGLEARRGAGLEGFGVSAQGRVRGDAQNVIEAVGPTPVENLGTAVVTVGGRAKISVRGQLARMARNSRRRKALASLPLGRLAGRSMAAMKRPAPSNTTIG